MSVPANERSHGKLEASVKAHAFELNMKKTEIYHIAKGIDFLGFHYKLTETGKVIMTVRSENVKRERKKLRRLVAKSKRGGLPREKVDDSYAAWRNHASKGNSYRLLKRMDAYYLDLWGDNNGSNQQKTDPC